MYPPRKNTLVFTFFSWYISRIIKKDFSAFNFSALQLKEGSILILANHFSWWDGFLIFQLNRKLFKKKFHVLVNADNYRKVGFLKYLGAFAPEKSGRDILETLSYGSKLLEDPNNLVLLFPQGKLYSNHLNYVNFEKGVLHLIQSGRENMNIVFAATFMDYFSKRKPAITIHLKSYEPPIELSLELLQNDYNAHYKESLDTQIQFSE